MQRFSGYVKNCSNPKEWIKNKKLILGNSYQEYLNWDWEMILLVNLQAEDCNFSKSNTSL